MLRDQRLDIGGSACSRSYVWRVGDAMSLPVPLRAVEECADQERATRLEVAPPEYAPLVRIRPQECLVRAKAAELGDVHELVASRNALGLLEPDAAVRDALPSLGDALVPNLDPCDTPRWMMTEIAFITRALRSPIETALLPRCVAAPRVRFRPSRTSICMGSDA